MPSAQPSTSRGYFPVPFLVEASSTALSAPNATLPNNDLQVTESSKPYKPRGPGRKTAKPWLQGTKFQAGTRSSNLSNGLQVDTTPPSSQTTQIGQLPTPTTPSHPGTSSLMDDWDNGLYDEEELGDNFSVMDGFEPTCAIQVPLSPLHSPISMRASADSEPLPETVEAARALLELSTLALSAKRPERLPTNEDSNMSIEDRLAASPCSRGSADSQAPRAPLSPRDLNLPTAAEAGVDNQSRNISPDKTPPRIPRKSPDEHLQDALKSIGKARLTPAAFIITILKGEDPQYQGYRKNFFGKKHKDQFQELLNVLWNGGRYTFEDWMEPISIGLVCDRVHAEMESAKPWLQVRPDERTPEFYRNWDLNTIMDPVREVTPTLSRVVDAATEPRLSSEESSNSKNDRRVGRNLITSQIHNLRSQASCKVQLGLGLMAWATGASRQLINVLSQACLTTSHSTILNELGTLGKKSLCLAQKAASGPHILQYDNVNISTSIHVEQTAHTPSKVQSGTFAMIYELPGVSYADLNNATMVSRRVHAQPLKLSDLRLSAESARSYNFQNCINIIQRLVKYVPGFSNYTSDSYPELSHRPRRPLSEGVKTKFYPLRCSTIEEASIPGNLQVHDDVYLVQLKQDPTELGLRTIPSINDQLTNARNRGAIAMRKTDLTPWDRRENLAISFGCFHMLLNLNWGILNVHKGESGIPGTLNYYFKVMGKARLNSDKPDFHTLLAALTQVLDGIILDAWRLEALSDGFTSLDAFAESKPTSHMLLDYARRIISKYATPTHPITTVVEEKKKKTAPSDLSVGLEANLNEPENIDDETGVPGEQENAPDILFENTIRLTRDLLYIDEIVDATASGDFGRIEDIIPDLACIFRGAGSNNYATEMLHFIHNTKEVWTPALANIIRDCMLVNPSGKAGHAMAIDMNIEHHIGYLKGIFTAKGVRSGWDQLGNISVNIDLLQHLKRQVTRSVNSTYSGSRHTTPNTDSLVEQIAAKAEELGIHQQKPDRSEKEGYTAVPDLRLSGKTKFQSASLAAFNKRLAENLKGTISAADEDELPAMGLTFETTHEAGQMGENAHVQ